MAGELLLEVGTEEIPSGYLEGGLNELKALSKTAFRENRINVSGSIYSCGTPRRLVLIGEGISEQQEDLVQETTGPPRGVAFDAQGKPTQAALGFARKLGISIKELETVETSKGEYLYAKTKVPGRPTREILAEVLPKVIEDIPWPKSMRWGSLDIPFVRPIHWVVALFNGEVIPFEIAGIKSGNSTRGHRFMAPEAVEVWDVQGYFQQMKKSFVLIDQEERIEVVEDVAKEAARKVSGRPAKDPELVTTVANLVEYPSAVCGSFDEDFLNLPASILITAMKEHQKYFAVYNEKGQLMPNFVAVNNTISKDPSIVRTGHERVLRARLSDADFFFKEDGKRPLGDRTEDLKGVIYQAELGTSFAKVERFTRLAGYLCQEVLPDRLEDVKLAARLSKCDLVTQMVTEFPSLQGAMGMEYARLEGYPDEICQAIHEHYLPTRAGGELPVSQIGAVVGCADRMDTIAGIFAIGREPTGSADPFALRRHALAIIRIMEDKGWDISFEKFIKKALSILGEELKFDDDHVFKGIIEFFRERYKQMMLRSGFESDLIEAIISVAFDRVKELRSRIEELRRFFTESTEFEPLALTFKRITNILKKEKSRFQVNPVLFAEPCEITLWDTYEALKDDLHASLERSDYYEALALLARLRKPVDDLFDGVEILTKESQALRENRVGLLQGLARLFLSVADFSKFSI